MLGEVLQPDMLCSMQHAHLSCWRSGSVCFLYSSKESFLPFCRDVVQLRTRP